MGAYSEESEEAQAKSRSRHQCPASKRRPSLIHNPFAVCLRLLPLDMRRRHRAGITISVDMLLDESSITNSELGVRDNIGRVNGI